MSSIVATLRLLISSMRALFSPSSALARDSVDEDDDEEEAG
jgi:hypothetical protein